MRRGWAFADRDRTSQPAGAAELRRHAMRRFHVALSLRPSRRSGAAGSAAAVDFKGFEGTFGGRGCRQVERSDAGRVHRGCEFGPGAGDDALCAPSPVLVVVNVVVGAEEADARDAEELLGDVESEFCGSGSCEQTTIVRSCRRADEVQVRCNCSMSASDGANTATAPPTSTSASADRNPTKLLPVPHAMIVVARPPWASSPQIALTASCW